MKNGWFTIKEVSDLFDNTRGAIRFYEEKGLIHPRRDEHDFRWYSVDDIFQLFYLRRYASMSFSLDETLHTFVKEAQLTLPEIQAQITKREQELNVQIERLIRQREELRKYQRVLRECQFPRTVIEECPDYYVLSADAFAKMTAADLPALKALIAAMPLTSVHADLIEGPSGWHSVTSLGIIEANARAAGIPLHPKMRKLQASKAAVRCVCCEWDAMPGQLIEKALAFRDEVIASGKTVHSFVSTSLILVHTQEGKTIEYHKCYVPFQDC